MIRFPVCIFIKCFFPGIILLTSIELLAQEKIISGKVTDGKNPIELANIAAYELPDTLHPAAFVSSNQNGFFQLRVDKIPVLIVAQLVGYAPTTIRIEKAKEDSIFIGVLLLKSLNRELDGFTVSGRKKMIIKTPDGLVVRADESITQAAGTVSDLLAATPTVLVDAEGAITVRGKSPLVLINGRNSVLGSSGLNRIPASSVDRIEITTMPSAKNDAEGEGGIINIILKKNAKHGTAGAVSVSGGMGAGGRFSSSLLLNKSAKEWDLGIGYDNRYAIRTRTVTAERENYASPKERFILQNRDDDRTEQTHNLRLEAVRKFKNNGSLSFEGLYEYDRERNYETLHTLIKNSSNNFMEGNIRISDENPMENVAEFAATYAREYEQEGRKMLAGVTHSYENGNEQTSINTTSTDAGGKPTGVPFLQRTSNKEITNITNLRFDYAFAIKPNLVFELGYKGVFRRLNSDYKSGPVTGDNWVSDPDASNQFDFSEQINAVYGQLKHTLNEPVRGAISWDAGLRLEQTTNNGQNETGSTRFDNSYLNAFPTGSFTTYLSKDHWLRLSYARRINRPGLGSLNPFVDITDSLNPHSGNPYLKTELVHSIDLGYNHSWEMGSAGVNTYYRSGTNTILPYTSIDTNGVALRRPENFGQSVTAGVEFLGNLKTGKTLNFTGSFSIYHQAITGEKETVTISSEQWTWYAKLMANLSLWAGSKWQWLFNYQAPTALPQGTQMAQYNVDMGFSQTCLRGKGRLGFSITDIFNTRQSGTNLSTPDFYAKRISKADTRAALLTFGYTFGSSFKEKVMKNQFNLE